MEDKLTFNSKVYTDIQGLKQLQYHDDKNSSAVKKEVAQQFESILMQMVLSSMRNANKAFASDLFGSDQMEFYQDMYDKQLALSLSNSGVGFADIVEKNINQMQGIMPMPSPSSSVPFVDLPRKFDAQAKIGSMSSSASLPAVRDSQDSTDKDTFKSQEDFVKKLWEPAKFAAKLIGATPEILLAQAALETNWGKSIIPHGKNGSTYNLFNIKAGSNWADKKTAVTTLEQKNGVLVKEKSEFRSYDSYMQSFLDYVNLLKGNTRYNESLSQASHPKQFIQALQNAGYATDQAYADKIMKIFSNHTFQDWVTKLKLRT